MILYAGPIGTRRPRALLVGESPAPRWDGDPRKLLTQPSFRRLAERVFWPDEPEAWAFYLTTFLRCNVIQRVMMKGERWPAAEAASNAVRIAQGYPDLPIVVLGRRAADAFMVPSHYPLPALYSSTVLRRRLCLLPHPSGRCRLWNVPSTVVESRKVFSSLNVSW